MIDPLADYIRTICGPLLDRPEDFLVERVTTPDAEHSYRVTVGAAQVGYLVGRGGETAEALRRLCRARARTAGIRGRVDIRIASVDGPRAHP